MANKLICSDCYAVCWFVEPSYKSAFFIKNVFKIFKLLCTINVKLPITRVDGSKANELF